MTTGMSNEANSVATCSVAWQRVESHKIQNFNKSDKFPLGSCNGNKTKICMKS